MSLAGERLRTLENAVHSKRYYDAESWFSELLHDYASNQDIFISDEETFNSTSQEIQKLADLLVEWFGDSAYIPTDAFFSTLCFSKSYLMYVFLASSYNSTDVIINKLGLLSSGQFTPDSLKKLLLLFTINSSFPLPWQGFFGFQANNTLICYVGILASLRLKFTGRFENHINDIVKAVQFAPIPDVTDIKALSPLIQVYFMCSNLSHPDKYYIKKWVVKVITKFMTNFMQNHFSDWELEKRALPQKPSILVIHEKYRSDHAMYRCWHYMLADLKNKFQVTALAVRSDIDENAKKDFDNTIELESELDLKHAVTEITRLNPDIIVYPSIGMSVFAPILASERFAPVQMVCGGHPSSSYFPNIDYFNIVDEKNAGLINPQAFTEKLLFVSGKKSSTYLLNYELPIVQLSKTDVHVAVNGLIQKVTKTTIDVCKKIADGSTHKVIFHFFSSSSKRDCFHLATETLLKAELESCELHLNQSYGNYMAVLAKCHFAIPTLPFGGANSNVDLIQLGIPKLFITDNNDLSGLTDHYHWEEFGLLDGSCESIEQLAERAIQLCNEPLLLSDFRNKVMQIDIEATTDFSDDRFTKTIQKLLSTPLSSEVLSESGSQLKFSQFHRISSYWFDCICQLSGLDTPQFVLTDDNWSLILKNAIAHIQNNDFKNAYKLTVEAMKMDSNRSQYLSVYLAGLVSYIDGDFTKAEQHFSEIVSADNDQVIGHYYVMLCHLKRRCFELAYQSLEKALKCSVSFAKLDAACALLMGIKRNYKMAEEYAKKALGANVEIGNGLVGLTLFQSLYQGSNFEPISNFPISMSYFEAGTEKDANDILAKLNPSKVEIKTNWQANALTVFISSDTNYFNQFVLPQIQSIINVSVLPVNVHVHIMNPREHDVKNAETLCADSKVGLLVTTENAPPNANGLYFSCARFCRLFEYFEQYENGVVSIDADMLFINDPNSLIQAKDIGVSHCSSEPMWQEISAALLYLNSTYKAKEYLANVSLCISKHLTSKTYPGRWFLDQMALYNAWKLFEPDSVSNLLDLKGALDMLHEDDSIVWAVANEKEKQSKFNSLREELKKQINSRIVGYHV